MAEPGDPVFLALEPGKHAFPWQNVILRQDAVASAGVSPEEPGPIAEVTAAFGTAGRISKAVCRVMVRPAGKRPLAGLCTGSGKKRQGGKHAVEGSPRSLI